MGRAETIRGTALRVGSSARSVAPRRNIVSHHSAHPAESPDSEIPESVIPNVTVPGWGPPGGETPAGWEPGPPAAPARPASGRRLLAWLVDFAVLLTVAVLLGVLTF